MPGAGWGARRPTRWSAPASCRTTAWCWVRARTSGRASRTPRSTRSTKPAHGARGATLYCTLEPCAHTGRTGPCTERVIAAGIRRVVAAMEDPFPLVRGRGFAALRASGIQVDVGVEHDAAVRLNQPYLNSLRTGRPFVTLKAATSLDGRIAAGAGAAHAADVAARAASRPLRAGAGGRGGRRLGHRARGRPAADGARGLPRAAADARRVRSPAAGAAGRAAVLDARPGAGHRDDVAATRCEAGGARIDALRAAGATVLGAEARRLPRAGSSCSDRSACRASCSKAAPRCTARRGTKASWMRCSSTWRRSSLGAGGVPLLDGRGFSSTALVERRVDLLGPDVLIEGYVHRPH